MTTKREAVLVALFARLQEVGSGVTVLRNAILPERIPDSGLIILRDGESGEPEITLSPLLYHWEHRAEVELLIRGASDIEASFDGLVQALGEAVNSDRTLSGLCDWVEAGSPDPVDLAVEGATHIRAAVVALTLHYTSADPLA